MHRIQKGFSLIEITIVMAIFLILSAAVFSLLAASQLHYRAEQQVLEALQGSRVAVTQFSRDVHRSGYPPIGSYDPGSYAALGAVDADGDGILDVLFPRVATPIGEWPPDCVIDTVNPAASTCVVPNPFELVLEADLDPSNTAVTEQVEYIYYRLETPGGATPPLAPAGGGSVRTLYRMVSDKLVFGADPRVPGTATYRGIGAVLTPVVENVLNDPALFPGDPAQAVFRYICPGGGAACEADSISSIEILLRVQTRFPDPLNPRTPGGELNYRAVTFRDVAQILTP